MSLQNYLRLCLRLFASKSININITTTGCYSLLFHYLYRKYFFHLLLHPIAIHYQRTPTCPKKVFHDTLRYTFIVIPLKNHFMSLFKPQLFRCTTFLNLLPKAKSAAEHVFFFLPCYKVLQNVTGATATFLLYPLYWLFVQSKQMAALQGRGSTRGYLPL